MGNLLQEELYYTTRLLLEENRKGKNLTTYLIVAAGAAAATALSFAAYLYTRDREAPQIEKLEFKERVEKGQNQEILICAKEQNPSEYATLNLNGTSINIPASEKSGEKICYYTSFNPTNYFNKEGIATGQLILTDKLGNSASKNITFLVNLEAPKIENVEIERLNLGKYRISAEIKDENLRNVFIILDDSEVSLAQEYGKFKKTIETLKDLNFTLIAEDKFNMTSSYRGKIEFSKDNPNIAYAMQKGLNQSYIQLILPLDGDGTQDPNEKQFIDLILNNTKVLVIPTFYSYLKDIASDGVISSDELKQSRNFATLVSGVYDIIYDLEYSAYVWNPIKTINYSSDLGLRLGFDKELARNATIKAISYYGIAVIDRKLPENFEEISLLTKATQIENYGDKLVDFSPIVFHSIDGNNYVLVPNVGRETWMLARHLKLIDDSGFDILNHPEMFEGLNGKVIANAYSIFDAPYGINYSEEFINRRTLKPTDKDVWDLIMLQWNLYSNKAPQLGGGSKFYNRDFPWYDSDKLDLLYQDPNTRRQALLSLFHIDNGTFDIESAQKFQSLVAPLPRNVRTDLYTLMLWGSTIPTEYYNPIYPGYKVESINDILTWIDLVTYEKKLIDENTANKLKSEIVTIPYRFISVGLKGARTALLQAEKSYEIISKLYPNGTVLMHIRKEPADVRFYYYGWITDRGFHGLGSTHMQFVGTDPRTLTDIIAAHPTDFWNYIKNFNGIDQYLTKNWKYWDLMKFAMGYERWYYVGGMIEKMTINYTIPQTLKAFGFPTYFVHIDPTPIGAAWYEWVVSLPDYAANKLKAEFGDRIIIGPANGFGLYLCKDGLIKDGVREIFGFFGGTFLYKSKGGIIKANIGLAPNFGFYLMRR